MATNQRSAKTQPPGSVSREEVPLAASEASVSAESTAIQSEQVATEVQPAVEEAPRKLSYFETVQRDIEVAQKRRQLESAVRLDTFLTYQGS